MQVRTVQPALQFIPPALNHSVLTVTQKILPFWLRYHLGISHVQAHNVERLAKLYHQFQLSKTRFLIAFRHPTLDDPACLHYLLAHILPQEARKHNIPLRYPTHAHFIYERGIPLWAGSLAGWLFSRLGATPIHRGKIDFVGLRSARDKFVNGELPIAAAPEGTLNGCSERMNILQPGVAQLGFWCKSDLLKARQFGQVVILPVGIKYHYVRPNWEALEKLVIQLETDCGLTVAREPGLQTKQSRDKRLTSRLIQLGYHILLTLEDFYTRFYHQPLPKVASLDERLHAVQNAALNTAERYFGLQNLGTVIERRHRIEQAAWDWIYREDIDKNQPLPAMENGLANHIVEMTNLYLWHMRFAESFWGILTDYVQEKPTFERFAESTLLLWNVVTNLKGGKAKRPDLGQRWVELTVGEEISVTQRWDEYCINRRQAVNNLTQDLQKALEVMISPTYPNSEKLSFVS
ncbi:phospholipid/glycerol acyltransferase [Rivularia sp. IAM M-261]|nr:phospholipid/glycerol acyltransferase [Rivularia sp. IAM M-261]